MVPPLSPPLSACDSLDSDELDAFLASQGALSHFPTPPRKQAVVTEAIEVLEGLALCETPLQDYDRAAFVLAQQASIEALPTSNEVDLIRDILRRADPPSAIVAIAHNILAGLRPPHNTTKGLTESSSDLLVAAALSLALSYTSDSPTRTLWWSGHCTWTASRIDKTIMEVLFILDFRLRDCSEKGKLQEALLKLSSENAGDAAFAHDCPSEADELMPKKSLDPLIDGTSSRCKYGQLTPDSCASPVAACCPHMD
ncbi:hypothetical protein DOTSEDRAFT_69518 [Dothistroma septosporum NZE10]|uniref:Uncharacterized protein n=1 Tax=Dothistroma septosporum (strain NZE10 / CBS 128990) TaxID=675120 RepID=N1PX99_DOTSN|nr:hypothetical protein DOTSEDRAFT_69518 [Dothistroma septosporum NZE10]